MKKCAIFSFEKHKLSREEFVELTFLIDKMINKGVGTFLVCNDGEFAHLCKEIIKLYKVDIPYLEIEDFTIKRKNAIETSDFCVVCYEETYITTRLLDLLKELKNKNKKTYIFVAKRK